MAASEQMTSEVLLWIVECRRQVLHSLHDRVDNGDGVVHQVCIARSVGRVHFISVKEIISDPPDGIQQLHRRGYWGCLIAELGLRVVLHEKVFGRPLDKCRRNVGVADAFEEVGRQIGAQTFATRLGDPPMLGPAEIAALLHRKLEPGKRRKEAEGSFWRQAIEEFICCQHRDIGILLRVEGPRFLSFHVASMSRGAAGKIWEALKTNGNFCDMTRHGIRENASQFVLYLLDLSVSFLAGAGGFEPPHGGIKIPCLTTWRRPN